MEMALVWILRAVGLLWLVGGALVAHNFWQTWQIGRMADTLEAVAKDLAAEDAPSEPEATEDNGRDLWIAAGGVLTFLAGCALLVASRFAVPACFALCLHQTLFVGRQLLNEGEPLSPASRNAAVFAFGVTACAFYLAWSGAYG